MRNIRYIINSDCQYDCFYCPLRSGIVSLQKLTEDELVSICRILSSGGNCNESGNKMTCVEITGGEPLLYDDISGLVKRLKEQSIADKVFLTTNGLLLNEKIKDLKEAGIDGVNIHLDTTESDGFTAVTKCSQVLNEVLKGLWRACAMKIPVTVTSVVHKYSFDQLSVIGGLAKRLPVSVRFVWIGQLGSEFTKDKVLDRMLISAGEKIDVENNIYHPEGWAGNFTFGNEISGAFGVDDAIIIGGTIAK